jgi:hypothetical protein
MVRFVTVVARVLARRPRRAHDARCRVTPIIFKIPMKNGSVAITMKDDLVNHSLEIQPYGFDPTTAGLLPFSSGAAIAIP